MTTDHIVKSFDEELSRLSDLISRMGGLTAESQLEDAIEALQTARFRIWPKDAVAHDRLIDDLHAEVDEMAIRLLALRQPMAGDLRHIVTSPQGRPDGRTHRGLRQERRQTRPSRSTRCRRQAAVHRSRAWAQWCAT